MCSKILLFKYENKHLVITLFNIIKLKIKSYHHKAFNNHIILCNGKLEKEINNINKIQGLKIQINGYNNLVKIHLPYKFNNCSLLINGNNNKFECFETKSSINNTIFNMQIPGNCRNIIIGKNTYIGEALIINNKSHSSINIGDDCMLSSNIHIRTDDGHIICQKGTNNIINNGGDVYIGRHCWLARQVFISKNVSIADNSIIGAGAIVTRSQYDSNTILAGAPAKVVKDNVDWFYNQKELQERYQNEG